MNNFEFERNGEKFWYSRSVAVAAFVFCKDKDGDTCVLCIQRGQGAETCKGFWAVPSGYLDFNETTKRACQREIWEETGLAVGLDDLRLVNIIDDPKGKKQNIVLNFTALLDRRAEDCVFSTEHMETDEIADVRWVKLKDLDDYKKFGYNGKSMIRKIVKEHSFWKRLLRKVVKCNLDK